MAGVVQDSRESPDPDFDIVEPSASPVIQSMRALGYVPETAVADIVDNSLDANATRIWIDMVWSEGESYVRIADNGEGLDERTLVQAMKLGSKDPRAERRNRELGRFGMGLKTASFSMGKRLTVLTRHMGGQHVRCWDLDVIQETNQWRLRREAFPESRERLGEIPGETGTVVLIEKLDRLAPTPYTLKRREKFFDQITVVEAHLQMVFHRFLEATNKVEVYLNGNPLVPWDPFGARLPATQEMPREDLPVDGKIVTIQGFILPHHSRIEENAYQDLAGPHKWFDHQGFYIYRNQRMLVTGGWLGLYQKDEPSQLARIRVDIDQNSDFDWQIDVRKSVARPPQEVLGHLKRWAEQARKLSHRAYYHRGKRSGNTVKPKGIPSPDEVWVKTIMQGAPRYDIDTHHPLMEMLRQECSEEGRKLLRVLIRTLQEFNPANNIHFGPESTPLLDEAIITEEDRESIVAIASVYTTMMTFQEAALQLKAMPHYVRYALPEILRVMKEGVK